MFVNVAAKRSLPALPRPILAALGFVPRRVSFQKRLEAFPTEGLPVERPVTVRWNRHQVPYIEAESDADLAFALGLVHAHLRGGHMALMRMVAQGRLSELMGPFAKEFDHALRILDFPRAVSAMQAAMPEETRRWLTRFVDGLNHYQSRCPRRPPELRLLRLKPEPWTVDDVLANGRVLGADFNWLTFLTLLPHRKNPHFARLWRRLLEAGGGLVDDEPPGEPESALAKMLVSAGRAGSNAVVISGARSASGAGMIASDPHLGLSLPNIWVLAGLISPSYRVVGLMLSGLPFVCIGRNPDLAWGGTHMRAVSTDLYDVSSLPESEITTEETHIKMRLAGTAKRRIRRTRFGPILSDVPLFHSREDERIAIRWVGHEATDEVSCFLRAARTRSAAEFRDAFESYGLPSQNLICADRAGNIARIMAVTLPVRDNFPAHDFVRDAAEPSAEWRGFIGTGELPSAVNPPEGIIVSANQKPPPSPVPVGILFDPGDRLNRLRELLDEHDRISTEDLTEILCDTTSPVAARLAGRLGAALEALDLGEAETGFARRLLAWDGNYAAESTGALAFEVLLAHLVPLVHDDGDIPAVEHYLSQWNFIAAYLEDELDALDPEERRTALLQAVSAALSDCRRYRTWGDMHRVRIAHILAKVPLIGGAFVVGEMPADGSRQTALKSSHGLVSRRHYSDFGSMARHISDLSDEDANWFVLFGGQDGWLGSESFADQVALWKRRNYIRMPLSAEAIAEDFPLAMTLTPN